MTSNLGGRQIVTGGKHLGFKQIEGNDQAFASIKSTVQDELKRTFNPEFLNRIDDVIVFHALTREHMQAIVLILLQQVRDRLRSQEVTLDIEPAAVEFLVERGFDPSLGARPLKRAIQRLLKDPFAEHILRGRVKGGGTVRVERHDDVLEFATRTDGLAPEAPPAGAPAPASQGG